MIKPVSKNRFTQILNDFQVLKGACPKTMKPFGEPVAAAHEAKLLIKDDQSKLSDGTSAMYVVHQRSENRIVHIVEAAVMPKRSSLTESASRFPLPKAA